MKIIIDVEFDEEDLKLISQNKVRFIKSIQPSLEEMFWERMRQIRVDNSIVFQRPKKVK